MTGLEPPGDGSSSSNSSSNAASLSLPLWAFRFNRSAGSPNLHLYNVTLLLSLSEFSLLLEALSTQAAGEGGAGAAPARRLSAGNVGGLDLQVRNNEYYVIHHVIEEHASSDKPSISIYYLVLLR